MLSFDEFTQQIAKDVQNKIEAAGFQGYSYEIKNDIKKNNRTVCGLYIGKNNAGAILPLDDPYENYTDGISYDMLLDAIVKQLTGVLANADLKQKAQDISNYETARRGLLVTLIGVKGNEGLLDECPHRLIEDMAIVYRIMTESVLPNSSVLIRYSLMEKWGISEEQLYEDAMQNSVENFPAKSKGLLETLREFALNNFSDIKENEAYVVSSSKCFGASAILYPGFLESVADKLHADLVILPSSIHECLILPYDETKMSDGAQPFLDMVKQINAEVVAPEERLTDNVYFYDRKNKKFGIMTK